MKNTGRIAWGVGFILVALAIVAEQMGWLAGGFTAFQIIIAILCLVTFIGGIANREFFGIFLPLGIAWAVFDKTLGLPEVSFWVVMGVVVLLSIGFSIIFPKKNVFEHGGNEEHPRNDGNTEFHKVTDEENGGYVNCSNKFGEQAKYINMADFKGANLDNSFGELKVYFDQAKVVNGPVNVRVNNNFGSLQLFIPKEWNVRTDVKVFAANCRNNNMPSTSGTPVVNLVGSVAFGEIIITYV